MDDYINKDPASFEKCCKEANTRSFAFLYLENSDQVKYGSIMRNLVPQKSLGNDHYPKTIAQANNVLSNHRFDVMTSKKNVKGTHQESTKDKESDEASAVEKEAIDLPNVTIRADLRKNGPYIRQSWKN